MTNTDLGKSTRRYKLVPFVRTKVRESQAHTLQKERPTNLPNSKYSQFVVSFIFFNLVSVSNLCFFDSLVRAEMSCVEMTLYLP